MHRSYLRSRRFWSLALAVGVSVGHSVSPAGADDGAPARRPARPVAKKNAVTRVSAIAQLGKPGYCRDLPAEMPPSEQRPEQKPPSSQPPSSQPPSTPPSNQPEQPPTNPDVSSFNPSDSGAIGNPNLVASASTPFMVGDAFGNPTAPDAVAVIPAPPHTFVPTAPSAVFGGTASDPYVAASPGNGGFVGRNKLAENVSPMPRDRVFFNYSFFSNVPLTPSGPLNPGAGGTPVSRFTPGVEKTFFEGATSLELRLPFASTLNQNIFADGTTNTTNLQFGNISLIGKGLIYRSDTFNMSTGMQITVPTAPDISASTGGGIPLYTIKNQAVHLAPFLAGLYTPDDRLFAQGLLQVDVDTNGNSLSANNFDGLGLTQAGRLRDATFLYFSMAGGYWVYRNPDNWISGIAPTAELHYNRSVSAPNTINSGGNFFASSHNSIEVINAVIGCNFEINQNSMLTLGYATPLGGGADRQFDGEFRAFFNYRFGPQTRLVRSQIAR